MSGSSPWKSNDPSLSAPVSFGNRQPAGSDDLLEPTKRLITTALAIALAFVALAITRFSILLISHARSPRHHLYLYVALVAVAWILAIAIGAWMKGSGQKSANVVCGIAAMVVTFVTLLFIVMF